VGVLIVTLIAGPVPLGALISAALAGYCMIFLYEWTHFLIHTAYRPRSAAYKAIWKNHRLHHFKNEDFWHGVTNNLSDRVLGTNPDQREVPKSKTARTLDPGAAH
ncbi:MAG TPA: sterol desaturase family protein, partial [Solirubrobacterales bacterium]|nr:sterol desaturase family protein [Solirubrobacterales bacterium]